MAQETEIDTKNRVFWDEPCGTTSALPLGVVDRSPESLRKFDEWYLRYYPYLLNYLKPATLRDKKVLEIGLGYGTVGQKIVEAGAKYDGLDIAQGPVDMMRHRFQLTGLTGQVTCGNMLCCPFDSNTFDIVISIGCFHMTGDIEGCLNETHRILKPGGKAILMVYNQLSYIQWLKWPKETLKGFLSPLTPMEASYAQRAYYDVNTGSEAAPEMELLSIRRLRALTRRFSSGRFFKENCGDHLFGSWRPRRYLLSTLGRWMGNDIYFVLWK